MSVLVNQETRILCQGITGSQGSFHAEQCIEYGSNIVAGVTPGKGGSTHLDVPVFNSVAEATSEVEIDVSMIFVPAKFAAANFAGTNIMLTSISTSDVASATELKTGTSR